MFRGAVHKAAEMKKKSASGIDKMKASGDKLITSIKSTVSRMTGVKRWENELKKSDKAHEFLADYYEGTNHEGIEYGAFGLIDLNKLRKHNFTELFKKLSIKKYDKSHVKNAMKSLKIKSVEVKNKTQSQIMRRIEDALHEVRNSWTEKIDEYKTLQKTKLDKKKNKIFAKKEVKIDIFSRSIPRVSTFKG